MKPWTKKGKEVSGIKMTSFIEDIWTGMKDSLFEVYQFYASTKLLWDALEDKLYGRRSSSKKFLVCNFNAYKMIDNLP